MAYIINQPAPPPVIIEQAPPPVIYQAQPAPVIVEQAPPPVIYHAPPAPVYVEKAPPPVVIQTTQPVVINSPMKSNPASVRCRLCQNQVVTNIKPINGLLTWVLFGVLCGLGIWPCCLIPFCVKSCKDIRHTCPHCQNVLHIHKRM